MVILVPHAIFSVHWMLYSNQIILYGQKERKLYIYSFVESKPDNRTVQQKNGKILIVNSSRIQIGNHINNIKY